MSCFLIREEAQHKKPTTQLHNNVLMECQCEIASEVEAHFGLTYNRACVRANLYK